MENKRNPMIEATYMEESIIASCMIDKDLAVDIVDALKPEDFYNPKNSVLFKAISDLVRGGKSADSFSVISHLRTEKKTSNTISAADIASYLDRIPHSPDIKNHISTVLDKSALRIALKAANGILSGIMNGKGVEDVIGTMSDCIREIENKGVRSQSSVFGNVLQKSIDEAERVNGLGSKVSGVPSGIYAVDRLTAGFQKSDLIILAGRPAMGKTAFAINYMVNAAQSGFPVGFFSLEMSELQLSNRIIASEMRIPMDKFRHGGFTKDDWRKMSIAQDELSNLPIHIADNPNVTVTDIRRSIRQMQREHGIQLAIIDYLQLISSDRKSSDRRDLEVSDITRSLKLIAKELDIPILLLSQVNRKCESRDDRRPILSDLRESGAIEQDADVVMFVFRGIVYFTEDPKTKEAISPNGAEIIIAKQRQGPIGIAKIGYDPEYTRFRTLDTNL